MSMEFPVLQIVGALVLPILGWIDYRLRRLEDKVGRIDGKLELFFRDFYKRRS